MEAIGTLAGGIAHDFNNILGAILGYGELAHQHSAEGSPLRRYLDNVMHAAERAQMLVERILGFSRSGLGDRAAVNVQFVIEETLELLEASLPAGITSREQDRSRQFGGDRRCDLPAPGGDESVHQRHTSHGSRRRSSRNPGMRRSRRTADAVARLACPGPVRAPHGRATPAPALRQQVLDRIFDPFFTTKGVGQGTGLGLSLVHGIVSDLGGAIDVTSKIGEGTRFEIWLPVAGETAMPAAEAARTLPHGKGETVMIVDDERPLVALAEETAAQLGYEPVGFDSSSAALEAFRATPLRFDAVLTDEAMPELDRHRTRARDPAAAACRSSHPDERLRRRAAHGPRGQIGVNERAAQTAASP